MRLRPRLYAYISSLDLHIASSKFQTYIGLLQVQSSRLQENWKTILPFLGSMDSEPLEGRCRDTRCAMKEILVEKEQN